MTLTELRFIVADAQKLSFRRAAEKLFICQLALSLDIQKLEEKLCVKIFDCSTSEILVTPIGTAIVEQAMRATKVIYSALFRLPNMFHRDVSC